MQKYRNMHTLLSAMALASGSVGIASEMKSPEIPAVEKLPGSMIYINPKSVPIISLKKVKDEIEVMRHMVDLNLKMKEMEAARPSEGRGSFALSFPFEHYDELMKRKSKVHESPSGARQKIQHELDALLTPHAAEQLIQRENLYARYWRAKYEELKSRPSDESESFPEVPGGMRTRSLDDIRE